MKKLKLNERSKTGVLNTNNEYNAKQIDII